MAMTKPQKFLRLLTFILFLGSVLALLAYSYFATHFPSQVPLKNYYLNLWYCGFLNYFLLQSIVFQSQTGKHGKSYVIANNAYLITMAIVFLEMAASWDVYG